MGKRQITWKAEVSQKKAGRRRPKSEARRREGSCSEKYREAVDVTNSTAGLQQNLFPRCDDDLHPMGLRERIANAKGEW